MVRVYFHWTDIMKDVFEHIVEAADSDMRLDRWLKRYYPAMTHGFVEKALRKGDIRVDGIKAKAPDRVTKGQKITLRKAYLPLELTVKQPLVQNRELSERDTDAMLEMVLYKDEQVIVINKPPGLAVQGGTGITRSVDGMLDALRFGAKERPKLVHRLDKDTSGVLVLARSAQVAALLMPIFARKKAEKIYWALVKGTPEPYEGKIDLPLSKKEEGMGERVVVDQGNGKSAITHYRVVDKLSNKLAWVELEPVTGRMHQLRVHMASIGHPIIGDGKYGGREAFVQGMELSNMLHLHARRIQVPGMFDVTAPLPPHMENSFATLGLEA